MGRLSKLANSIADLLAFFFSASIPAIIPLTILTPTSSLNFLEGECTPSAFFAAANALCAMSLSLLYKLPAALETPDLIPLMMFLPTEWNFDEMPDQADNALCLADDIAEETPDLIELKDETMDDLADEAVDFRDEAMPLKVATAVALVELTAELTDCCNPVNDEVTELLRVELELVTLCCNPVNDDTTEVFNDDAVLVKLCFIPLHAFCALVRVFETLVDMDCFKLLK